MESGQNKAYLEKFEGAMPLQSQSSPSPQNERGDTGGEVDKQSRAKIKFYLLMK